MSNWTKTPGQTQDTLERLCLSAGLGTPQYSPGGGRGGGWGERGLSLFAQSAAPAVRTRIGRG